ncbi:MAG: porin, partial [Cycloclasticus sp.]
MSFNSLTKKISLIILLSIAIAPQASALTLEDLAKRLDALEAQNKQLQQENANLRVLVTQTDKKAEAAVLASEAIADSTSGIQKLANFADKTTLGGYGELHYNNLSGKGGASDKDEVDFHRFVLFFGHEFND